MDFDYDVTAVPAAPALSQPYASGLAQPPSEPTTMFGGSIPGVQFAPVTPIQAAVIAALHGPAFQPVYHNGLAKPTVVAGRVHAIVGTHLDRRG